jgi:hypothetical protein
MSGDREMCLEAGMNDYISKPIREDDLTMALQRACQSLPDHLSSSEFTGVEDNPELKSLPIIDEQTIATIRELGGVRADSILNKIIKLYLADSPQYLQQIEAAIAHGDADALRKAAHSLGSSSANLGALAFAQACKQIENKSRSQDLSGIEADGLLLTQNHKIVQQALEALICAP